MGRDAPMPKQGTKWTDWYKHCQPAKQGAEHSAAPNRVLAVFCSSNASSRFRLGPHDMAGHNEGGEPLRFGDA